MSVDIYSVHTHKNTHTKKKKKKKKKTAGYEIKGNGVDLVDFPHFVFFTGATIFMTSCLFLRTQSPSKKGPTIKGKRLLAP